MKEISNKTLLAIQVVADGLPMKYISSVIKGSNSFEIAGDKVRIMTKAELGAKDNWNIFGLKAIKKEIENRKLRTLLPIIINPNEILIQPIEVKERLKTQIDLALPDSQRMSAEDKFNLLKDHPLQAIIVGIGANVDYPDIGIGSKVYMKASPRDSIIYNETRYFLAPAHLIGCLVFK